MLGPPSRVGRGLETEPLARCTFQTQTPGPSPPTPPGWAHSLPPPAGLGEQGRLRSHHPHQRVLGPLPLPRPFLPGEGSYLFLSPVLPRVALSGKASPLLSGTVRNCSGLTTGKPRFFYQNTVSDTIPRPPTLRLLWEASAARVHTVETSHATSVPTGRIADSCLQPRPWLHTKRRSRRHEAPMPSTAWGCSCHRKPAASSVGPAHDLQPCPVCQSGLPRQKQQERVTCSCTCTYVCACAHTLHRHMH